MSLTTISIVTVTVQPVSDFVKTANSLLSQTDAKIKIEWVIVVGKYYDEYLKYLERFTGKFDIKILFQPPQGIYSAMNFGLSNVNGDWIWFINCGDYLKDPHTIFTLEKIFSENPNVELVASPVLYVTPQDYWFDISWPNVIKSETGLQAHAHHQGVLVRRSICHNIDGGFDTSLNFAADGKFLDEAISHAEYLIVDSVFCVFVMGGASAKNYVRTVRESFTYRKNGKLNLTSVVKNWFRQLILLLLDRESFSFLLRPFIERRSKAIERIIGETSASRSPNTH